MRSRLFSLRWSIASLLLIGCLCGEGGAQASKENVFAVPKLDVLAFDAKQLKWRTDLVGSEKARQLELTIDFSNIDKLYDIQSLTVQVAFFLAGKSIGTESFQLATAKMQGVKDRKKIKHDFALSKKYQKVGITIKGIQITAPATSDYRYVYQEPSTPRADV